MAQRKHIPIRDRLQSLFSNRWLKLQALETGAVRRQRKVNIVSLFWTLVLGFSNDRERSISGFRNAYEKRTRTKIEESSFYNRFSAGLALMLERALAHAMREVSLGANRPLRGILAQFEDAVLTDGSLIRLHDMLARYYPGCRTNHSPSSAKTHIIMNVAGKSEQSIKITNGRKHDGPNFKVTSWVRGRLLLFDLGYFKLKLFRRIHSMGGFFVSRLKGTTDPIIRSVHVPWSADNRRAVKNRSLQSALRWMEKHQLTTLDAVAEFGDGSRFRIIAIRDPKGDQFHTYVTNIGHEELSADQIRGVYALRWMIELLFKELKSIYRLEDLPSRKALVAKSLLYAALLTLFVSRHLLAAFRLKMGELGDRIPELRWAKLFRGATPDLLQIMIADSARARILERELSEALIHEAPDPNYRCRPSLLRAVESGTHAYRDRKCHA